CPRTISASAQPRLGSSSIECATRSASSRMQLRVGADRHDAHASGADWAEQGEKIKAQIKKQMTRRTHGISRRASERKIKFAAASQQGSIRPEYHRAAARSSTELTPGVGRDRDALAFASDGLAGRTSLGDAAPVPGNLAFAAVERTYAGAAAAHRIQKIV